MTTTLESGSKAIAYDVLDVLRSMDWVGGGGTITEQLDRKMYLKVNKVLKALGGKWDRTAQAHLFEDDGETAIRQACESGVYVDLKKAYQFFESTDPVIDRLIELIGSPDLNGVRVLEPSAGKGAIARRLRDLGAIVTCVELNPAMAKELSEDGFETIEADFLSLDKDASCELFDYIVMNPPFSKSQDIQHVLHAHDFLHPAGTMASVMSPGFTFRSDSRAKRFRDWLDEADGDYEELPEGSFKSSGTNVRTVAVSIGG